MVGCNRSDVGCTRSLCQSMKKGMPRKGKTSEALSCSSTNLFRVLCHVPLIRLFRFDARQAKSQYFNSAIRRNRTILIFGRGCCITTNDDSVRPVAVHLMNDMPIFSILVVLLLFFALETSSSSHCSRTAWTRARHTPPADGSQRRTRPQDTRTQRRWFLCCQNHFPGYTVSRLSGVKLFWETWINSSASPLSLCGCQSLQGCTW
jgi:hypothetical protein